MTCGDVGILQALTEVREKDGRRVDDEPQSRVPYLLGVADTRRGIAAQLRFDLRRGDQLLALAVGFERFARRLERRPAPTRRRSSEPADYRSDPICLAGTSTERAGMVFFAYHIVPSGGHMRQALERGTCTAPDVELANRQGQTVRAPSVAGKTGLEVILQDSRGAEIWRGPYLGHA